MTEQVDIVIIGAGIIGLSCGYHLARANPSKSILLIDQLPPHSYTSAQSGENYRNWWPHPIMKQFIEDSITHLVDIKEKTDNAINLTDQGYMLATRSLDVSEVIASLRECFGEEETRIHCHDRSDIYLADTQDHYDGVDIITSSTLIQSVYPYYPKDITTLFHIRKGGMLDSQQLGQFFLREFKALGGKILQSKVTGIETDKNFRLSFEGASPLKALKLVNAAGPYVQAIAEMLGEKLPVSNILQQKIAFKDKLKAIDRSMPFTIDLDTQFIDWSDEDRSLLAEEESLKWLTEEMPGAVHCRPEGGLNGDWLKLGWAYNTEVSDATLTPSFEDSFPEIVLRGAARLHPSLKQYYDKLPSERSHYGGYYTMTPENWPLIGPMKTQNAYVIGAMSGFGTMAACAAGDLCARWVHDESKPAYAEDLSLMRYNNKAFMSDLLSSDKRGIL
ncbi:FAD-dependent oxidoreductase [Temperatibacter marinus]|uniref:FAD-dependent oxidoreductase n=1 Tax=Temperatibacter marinus TaxID=1456591 RepID=A0AA52EG02_9PROT|nr:FAD-dependent oxidoreductase [Temperatibacter marinus]WND01634.1 FAD-dependent oxidoreductase [Temperatibacter marinus]